MILRCFEDVRSNGYRERCIILSHALYLTSKQKLRVAYLIKRVTFVFGDSLAIGRGVSFIHVS